MAKNNTISGWGNFPVIKGKLIKVSTTNHLKEVLNRNKNIIPFGNGRSYGDSALSDNMIHYNNPDASIDIDEKTGVAMVSAATQIGSLIDHILPLGWFPPVVPGTKFVTIGGAIAADIHGKNHHVDGCFSQYIISFELMLPNGDVIQCSRIDNAELFRATCGGMGLTGVILNARIKMLRVQSRFIEQISYRAQNIDELFAHFSNYDSQRYSVAWIDCTAKGMGMGRGVLITGEFLNNGTLSNYSATSSPRLNIPFFLPSWLINPFTLKIFNTLYYHLLGYNEQKKIVVELDKFFFPLDKLHNWNKLYGKNGFLQYQFVLPLKNSKKGIKQILHKITSSGQGSPLAVLKLFGPKNDNYLSFPTEGYTLALDFKNQPSIFPLLDELDRIVLDLKGKIYLAKDARMTKEHFEYTYENLQTFFSLRQEYGMRKKLKSFQSQRLSL